MTLGGEAEDHFAAGDAAGLLAALDAVKKEVTVKVETAKIV